MISTATPLLSPLSHLEPRRRAARNSGRLSAIIATQNELFASNLDLKQVMTLVAERTEALAGASGAAVEMLEGEALVYRAVSGALNGHLGQRIPSRGSLSGLCLDSRQLLCSSDTELDPRVNREACRQVGIRSMIVAPLIHDGRAVGVLKVMAESTDAFDVDEQDTLQLMSGLIAAAIARASGQEARTQLMEAREAAVREALAREAERATLQQRLDLSDRMASVGRLAAGVAHEANNPLAYVIANLEFLKGALGELKPRVEDEDHAEMTSALMEAREGAERVRAIIRDLHSFSRSDKDVQGQVNVAEMVERSLAMAAHELRHRAQVVRELSPVPLLLGNEARLGQVVLNLLVNASHAMPKQRSPDQNRITVRSGEDADGRTFVEVEDNGSGIDAATLSHIFDPFFTTKPVGQGMGVGLSICHNIVQSHGGELRVQSTPGVGSTFRMLLPASARLETSAAQS